MAQLRESPSGAPITAPELDLDTDDVGNASNLAGVTASDALNNTLTLSNRTLGAVNVPAGTVVELDLGEAAPAATPSSPCIACVGLPATSGEVVVQGARIDTSSPPHILVSVLNTDQAADHPSPTEFNVCYRPAVP